MRLIMLFVSTLAGTGLLLLFLLGEGYREAERQAEDDARNIVHVLESRLLGSLQRVQATLEHVAATVPADALQSENASRYHDAMVRDLALYAGRFEDVIGYRVADAQGRLLYSSEDSRLDGTIIDRTYFQVLRDDPLRPIYFSEVLDGRLSGRAVMIIAVPVRNAKAAFLGIVFAAVDLRRLQATFDAVKLGERGVITFRRSDDGRLVLRRPAVSGSVNQTLKANPMHMRIEAGEAEGSIRYQAALDGVMRVYAYRRVGGYPFYVAVGIASDDYLATWKKTSLIVGMSSLLLLLMLAWLLIRLLRQQREEIEIGRRLAESEARYRMLADNSHDVIWTLDVQTRRFSYISPSVFGMCGYRPEEVVGHSLDLLLAPESVARVAEDIEPRLSRIANGDAEAAVVVAELEVRARDGGRVAVEVVSSYLADAGGEVATILGITRNVSERKRAEAVLRESNRQLQIQLEEIGRLQAALQEQAIRDGLTGLYNRRYLDETLEREAARARREGSPLSLVMIDIDHFKRVNDTFGHQLGDEALRQLAATLAADVRIEDVACRYGGEEFLILLPNMPLSAAAARAEAWRRKVEGLVVRHDGNDVRISISVGVAACPEHGSTPDELTRCADQALYVAKAGGRNRVAVYAG